MKRRRLLTMLPLAPLAVLVAPAPIDATPEPEPIDTRPTYRLSEYWTYEPRASYLCQFHVTDHHAYTHGCQPAAFPRDTIAEHGSPHLHSATPDAIPVDVFQGCSIGNNHAPHRHNDFRWVD